MLIGVEAAGGPESVSAEPAGPALAPSAPEGRSTSGGKPGAKGSAGPPLMEVSTLGYSSDRADPCNTRKEAGQMYAQPDMEMTPTVATVSARS